ncbi:hypothetical protein QE152_g22330 [Popillia japonica]|uniref:Uncharacterized protein n=1 Tax=Popillia japonica TaxID=7064 RepID=A0AAW1KME6_POPJA
MNLINLSLTTIKKQMLNETMKKNKTQIYWKLKPHRLIGLQEQEIIKEYVDNKQEHVENVDDNLVEVEVQDNSGKE